MDDYLYIQEYEMLFEKLENDEYYPTLYKCKMVDGEYEGLMVKSDSIFAYWINFIKWSYRTESKIDGIMVQGNLRLFQWKLSFDLIEDLMLLNNKKWATMATRQSGKSRLIKTLSAFMVGFANMWLDLPGNYTVITMSYSEKSVSKLFQELRLEIYKAIEFFNLCFPERQLLLGKEAKQINLADNSEKLAIGMKIGDKEIPYSEIYAFSGGVVRDGYSAHAIFIDEAQFLDFDFTQKSVFPFTANTSGVIICTGICTADSQSLMYNFYFDDKVNKFIYSWKNHVKMLGITDPKKSKDYENYALEYIRTNGEHSLNTASNFTMKMDSLLEGKLLNLDILRNNNLMKGNLCEMLPFNKSKFVVIGIDIGGGGSGDRTIATVSENTALDNGLFYHEIKNIVPYTYEKDEHLNQADFYRKTKELAITNKADFIIADTTGTQKLIVSGLNEYLKKEGVKSQVIGGDFSGTKKRTMYEYFEGCMYSQRMIFPKEELARTDRGWGLLLKELLMMLKYKSGKNNYYSYEAPSKEHDDAVASAVISMYCVALVLQLHMEGKEVRFGSCAYVPKLQKANWHENKEKDNSYMPSSIWDIR